jgi:hypothetical protein
LGEAIRDICEKGFHGWLSIKKSMFPENGIVTIAYQDGEALA